ncbi:hypothetical protein RRF57_009044 [Xylaria bambusicola]|uniref:Uncharacterized protein n=1 Tax=Xylaria bambusicola TaxID=326684 RepID=A0AAN7UIW1_9PEZI
MFIEPENKSWENGILFVDGITSAAVEQRSVAGSCALCAAGSIGSVAVELFPRRISARKSILIAKSRITVAAPREVPKLRPKSSNTAIDKSIDSRTVGAISLVGHANRYPASVRAAFHCHWKASCQPTRRSVFVTTWWNIRVSAMLCSAAEVAWDKHVFPSDEDSVAVEGKQMNGL